MARADSPISSMDTQPLPAVLTGKNGTYRLVGEHARGGFGITFRACRVSDGLDVIVKYLPLAGLGDWLPCSGSPAGRSRTQAGESIWAPDSRSEDSCSRSFLPSKP
jgi:hypothetical protein